MRYTITYNLEDVEALVRLAQERLGKKVESITIDAGNEEPDPPYAGGGGAWVTVEVEVSEEPLPRTQADTMQRRLSQAEARELMQMTYPAGVNTDPPTLHKASPYCPCARCAL